MDNTKRKMELSNLAEEVRQKERQATHKETSVKKLEFDIQNFKLEAKKLEEEKK